MHNIMYRIFMPLRCTHTLATTSIVVVCAHLRVRGFPLEATSRVQRNDIDVAFASQRLQQAAELVRHLWFVIDAVDERPFKGNSALLRFDVLAARVNELRDGVAAVDGHDGAPSGVAGFVKRHR